MIYVDAESDVGVSQGAESQDFQFADWSRHPAGGPKASNEAFSLFKSNLKSSQRPCRAAAFVLGAGEPPSLRAASVRFALAWASLVYIMMVQVSRRHGHGQSGDSAGGT